MTDYVRYYNEDHSNTPDGLSESTGWQSDTEVETGLNSILGSAVNGDTITVYYKRSETARTNADLWTGLDSLTIPATDIGVTIIHEGYNSVIGDGGDDGINNYFQRTKEVQFSRCILRYFDVRITGQTSSGACINMLADGIVDSCYASGEATGSSNTVHGINLSYSQAVNCYAEAKGSSSGVSYAILCGSYGQVHNCVTRGAIHGNVRYGGFALTNSIIMNFPSGSQNRTTFASRGLVLLNGDIDPRGFFINGNLIYDSPGSGIWFEDGLQQISSISDGLPVFNTIIYGCAGYAIENGQGQYDTELWMSLHGSWWGSCTSGKLGGNLRDPGTQMGFLSADPFTDSANEDFTLNDTAGGGAAITAAAGTIASKWAAYGMQANATVAGPYQRDGSGGGGEGSGDGFYMRGRLRA